MSNTITLKFEPMSNPPWMGSRIILWDPKRRTHIMGTVRSDGHITEDCGRIYDPAHCNYTCWAEICCPHWAGRDAEGKCRDCGDELGELINEQLDEVGASSVGERGGAGEAPAERDGGVR